MASVINPRTNLPYVRAPYHKEKATSTAAQIAKQQAKATEAASKASGDKETIRLLKIQVSDLTAQLEALKNSTELIKKAAMLEASQASSMALLERYKDGLRDGASLAQGGKIASQSFASHTPQSASGPTDVPSSAHSYTSL